MVIIEEIEKYLENIGAKFVTFDKPNSYGDYNKHFISVKMSNGDVVIFEISPNDKNEESFKLTIYNDVNGSKMKTYSNNNCNWDVIFQKIKKYETYMERNNTLSLNELDLKTMVENVLNKVLSESFDAYVGTNRPQVSHAISLINNKLSGMKGVRVSDSYTNNDRVVIEMVPNSGNEHKVMDIMSELGYKYYSSNGGVSSRVMLIFKRPRK